MHISSSRLVATVLLLGVVLLPLTSLAQAAANPAPTRTPLDPPQWWLVFAPLILHLVVLLWLWRSKVTLQEALSDKETINKEAERVRQMRTAVLQQTFNRPLFAPQAAVQGQPQAAPAPADVKEEYHLRESVASQAFSQPLATTTPPTRAALSRNELPENEPGTTPPVGEGAKPITSVSRLIVFLSGYAALSIGTCLAAYCIYHGFAYPGLPLPSFDGLMAVLFSLGIGVVPYAVTKLTAATEPKAS